MTAVRVLNMLVWAAVLIYMAPSVWSIIRGHARAGDPARAACFGYAMVSVLFSARWLIAPASEELWIAGYALSMFVGLYTLHAAKAYGRGNHL